MAAVVVWLGGWALNAWLARRVDGSGWLRLLPPLVFGVTLLVIWELVVRGLCTLRPGVPGHSDRIRIVSRLGRFLEHARIYHFTNGGQDEYYIGSADWRPRNLRNRVEVVAPVSDTDARATLDSLLREELADPAGWLLRRH